MRPVAMLSCVLLLATAGSAAETLLTAGPQEYEGRKYYWLAEWKLEVVLPHDVGADDRFEVLFGSKGPGKRTLLYQYDGQSGEVADVRKAAYEWIELPLGSLAAGKLVVLSGRGREQIAFLAGLRHTCGAWLAQVGNHPKVVQTVMRHSTITLTMDTYGHLFPGQEADVVGTLPNMMGDNSPEETKATGTDGETVGADWGAVGRQIMDTHGERWREAGSGPTARRRR